MRITLAFTMSIFAGIASSALASPQPDSLVQQLRAMYPETVMDPNGLKVAKPGTILVVQMDGMMANPMKSGPAANTFTEGQFVRGESRSQKLSRYGIGVPQKNPTDRPVAVGAKVYLLGTESSSDAITFTVQTCGDCDPKAVDPGFTPYKAKVTFKFVKGALAETDAKHVRQVIEQVFKFPEGPAPAAEAQAPPPAPVAPPPPAREAAPAPAPAQAQQFAPISAPAPAPADQTPKVLKLGMSEQEVKDSFGPPASIVELGAKVIYVYKDKKITFQNGKVSDVEVR